MRILTVLAASASVAGVLMTAAPASADYIDGVTYPNAGQVNMAVYNFTGTGGDVTAQFAGSSAGDTDAIAMFVNGVMDGSFVFNNHTSNIGDQVNFGTVAAGATITFELYNYSTSTGLWSVAGQSPDGDNHAYAVNVAACQDYDVAGVGCNEAGVFVGFEDLAAYQGSDFDYNDDTYIFQNLAPVNVSEPGTLALFGVGLLGLAAIAAPRRRRATVL